MTDLLTRLHLTEEDLIQLYISCESVDEIASDLNCSTRTIRKYLNAAGIIAKAKPKRKPRRETGAFATWLRDNPHTVLPRSVSEIATMTNIKRSTVNSHLIYRQRKVYAAIRPLIGDYIKSYVDNGKLKLEKFTFPVKSLKRVTLTVDRFSLKLTVTAYLRDGSKFRFKTTKEEVIRRTNGQGTRST